MADAAWKRLNAKVNAKRAKKATTTTQSRSKPTEITVQRLSAEVVGKAQKYTRIGPREFVPIINDPFVDDSDDWTIDCIKKACEKHFLPRIGQNVTCDVLAGEQGPSCQSIDQVPDLKVIYVRFIPTASSPADQHCRDGPPEKKSKLSFPQIVKSSPTKQATKASKGPCPSVCCPRSLSVSDMIKLGKLNNQAANTTVVNIFRFDMEMLSWSKLPTIVEFTEEKIPIGSGAFRKAFKATSKHPEFNGSTWVIKRYIPEALKCIEDTGQTIEGHNLKVVQMHLLARNFTLQLQEDIKKNDASATFGKVLKYRKLFHGVTENNEYVTVEEYIPGQVTKYINNDGLCCVDTSDVTCQKAQCLSHYSYEKSEKRLIVLDIQGNGCDLYDPEIASAELIDADKQFLYCTGNLSRVAIDNFKNNHKCNHFCQVVGLSPF